MFIDLSNEFRIAANETLGSLEVILSFFFGTEKHTGIRLFISQLIFFFSIAFLDI